MNYYISNYALHNSNVCRSDLTLHQSSLTDFKNCIRKLIDDVNSLKWLTVFILTHGRSSSIKFVNNAKKFKFTSKGYLLYVARLVKL